MPAVTCYVRDEKVTKERNQNGNCGTSAVLEEDNLRSLWGLLELVRAKTRVWDRELLVPAKAPTQMLILWTF